MWTTERLDHLYRAIYICVKLYSDTGIGELWPDSDLLNNAFNQLMINNPNMRISLTISRIAAPSHTSWSCDPTHPEPLDSKETCTLGTEWALGCFRRNKQEESYEKETGGKREKVQI